jgi:hypothetical protein
MHLHSTCLQFMSFKPGKYLDESFDIFTFEILIAFRACHAMEMFAVRVRMLSSYTIVFAVINATELIDSFEALAN